MRKTEIGSISGVRRGIDIKDEIDNRPYQRSHQLIVIGGISNNLQYCTRTCSNVELCGYLAFWIPEIRVHDYLHKRGDRKRWRICQAGNQWRGYRSVHDPQRKLSRVLEYGALLQERISTSHCHWMKPEANRFALGRIQMLHRHPMHCINKCGPHNDGHECVSSKSNMNDSWRGFVDLRWSKWRRTKR